MTMNFGSFLATALLLSAPAMADSKSDTQTLDQSRAASALATLHHINQKEINMANLAISKTQSPAVKSYANHMITDHQAADAKVELMAQARGVALKDFQPAENEQSSMESLKKLSGTQFDAAYLDMMKSGHQIAYDQLKTTQAGVHDPEVNHLIGSLLPTVKEHHDLAKSDEKDVVQEGVAD